jgi:GntR family transcriptional regulator
VLVDLPNVVIASARQTLRISTADVEMAQLLLVPVNSPVAEVRRVFLSPDGTVLYLGQITYRGDFIQFEMQLNL